MKYYFKFILQVCLVTLAIFTLSACNSNSSSSDNSSTNYAYITDNGGHVWQYQQNISTGELSYVLEVTRPAMTESWAPDGMTFYKNYAYIADNNGALWLYNNHHGVLTYVESIAAPNNIAWAPQNITFNSNYAYVTDNNGNVWIYTSGQDGELNYSNQQVTPARTNWGPTWISFNGQFAYISDLESNGLNSHLWQYAVNNNGLLESPVEISAPNNESSWVLWGGVRFNGNYGYVADNNGHTWQYFVLNEESLIFMNQIALPSSLSNYNDWSPNNIGFSNGYAYIPDYYHAMVWCYKIGNNGALEYIESVIKPTNSNFVNPAAITFYNAQYIN